MQQNLDVMGKTGVRFGFSGQKYIENDPTHQLCISKKISVTQCDDNSKKFREVSMPRSCIFKNQDFRDFGL